jgi:hypothetical protein
MPVRLFLTTSVEENWRALAGPWLRTQAGTAWKNPKPTIVLTPGRAEGFYLRGRLVAEGVPFLGLRFWTPSDARQFLSGACSPATVSATRADLQLLASMCAERLLQAKDAPDATTLKSVVRDPEPFLRAYDLLLAAGWDPARDGAAYGRPLAREFGRELERSRLSTEAGFHRKLLDAGREQPGAWLASVLVNGFNATHWPLWDLLRAVVGCAEEAVVALSAPRVFGEEIDQLWISSWEEVVQGEALAPDVGPDDDNNDDNEPGALTGLSASCERGEAGDAETADLTFLATPDLTSQVSAVVLQAVDYLRRDSCSRLGIVFPEPNALALDVAEELLRLGLPINDGVGAIRPGLFERRFWTTWLAWQEEPSVARFIGWLRACEAQGVSCGLDESALSAREVADALANALGETLADDLELLTLYLGENTGRRHAGAVADFLRRRIVLPEVAPFAGFLAASRRALETLGWNEHLAALPSDPPSWLRDRDEELPRRMFLEWLKVSCDSRERIRGAEGNHFYGRVHLLIYAQMTGQTWSHLILTGLNEGVWPRVFEAGAFGSRHELTELNRQARSLNRLGTGQGGQGMGQETVRIGRGHCLLPREQQDLALRDLCAALDSTRCAVALAAMTTEAGRSLLPSDFFNHAFQAKTGRVLDEVTFQRLSLSVSEWTSRHDEIFCLPVAVVEEPCVAATRLAYDVRRDPTQAFGPYEFAYASPPAAPIQLTCKMWETAWLNPESVWLTEIVGAGQWPEGNMVWPQTIGTWVHRWIGLAFLACREQGSTSNFLPLLRKIADRESLRLRERARVSGLRLYPWWEHVRARAKAISFGLGETLAPHLRDKVFLSEFTLPENLLVALPGAALRDFELRGRIDLLLIGPETGTPDPERADFSGGNVWVIDFKTGAAGTLTGKKIAKGMGLQTVLYALAVRGLGAREIGLSLHICDKPLKRQVELGDVVADESIFRSLDLLHRVGVLGARGGAENDYGFAPGCPMATCPVPSEVLEAKWALVHGGAPENGEEES